MNTKNKYLLLFTGSVLLTMLGITGTFILSGLVFNHSYMMTLNALGEPGATLQLKVVFALCIAGVLIGGVGLIKSIGRLRTT